MTGTASPITVAHGGIYRWYIDSEFVKECTMTPIADAIRPLLDNSFFENAEVCYHRCRSELWFRDKSRRDGRIFIYHLDKGIWYSYSGLAMDGMFGFGGGVGFTKNGYIYLFDENRSTDVLEDGEHAITATYQSGYLDFGGLNINKSLTDVLFVADIPRGKLSVDLSDKAPLGEAVLGNEPTHAPNIYELRLPTGRFRAASLRLVCEGDQRHRIYRAELYAQKGKS